MKIVSSKLKLTFADFESVGNHYRAMYVVLALYCYRKLSVHPSVGDVEVPWAK